MFKPNYVYVASSWRNEVQPEVCAMLAELGIEHYDFKNPEGGTGFSWKDVKPATDDRSIPVKGSDWEPVDSYLGMVAHPIALAGYEADFNAMSKADTFILVLPCGKSAHLELGWACGAGKQTIILLEDPVEPELMYRMVGDFVKDVDSLRSMLVGAQEPWRTLLDACRHVMGDKAITGRYPDGLSGADVLTEIRRLKSDAFPLVSVLDVCDEMKGFYG